MPTSPHSDSIWIVHEDAEARALLRGLAGCPVAAAGGPAELPLDGAPAPRAVLLHVGRDAAAALDFAQRARARHPGAGWLLLRDERVPPEAVAGAFAGLGATVLAWPSEAERIPSALAQLGGPRPVGLEARRERDTLVRRYARLFGDPALPDLGGLGAARLVIRGEPGTGKQLAARVVHALAAPPCAFVYAACAGAAALPALAARLMIENYDSRCVWFI